MRMGVDEKEKNSAKVTYKLAELYRLEFGNENTC
jgi:hypothetical protein